MIRTESVQMREIAVTMMIKPARLSGVMAHRDSVMGDDMDGSGTSSRARPQDVADVHSVHHPLVLLMRQSQKGKLTLRWMAQLSLGDDIIDDPKSRAMGCKY